MKNHERHTRRPRNPAIQLGTIDDNENRKGNTLQQHSAEVINARPSKYHTAKHQHSQIHREKSNTPKNRNVLKLERGPGHAGAGSHPNVIRVAGSPRQKLLYLLPRISRPPRHPVGCCFCPEMTKHGRRISCTNRKLREKTGGVGGIRGGFLHCRCVFLLPPLGGAANVSKSTEREVVIAI
jgi:hypothetical protein